MHLHSERRLGIFFLRIEKNKIHSVIEPYHDVRTVHQEFVQGTIFKCSCDARGGIIYCDAINQSINQPTISQPSSFPNPQCYLLIYKTIDRNGTEKKKKKKTGKKKKEQKKRNY
jgi:hypothetical protein